MPPEGEKFDELLSGYIDGALNEAERQQVEQAALDDLRVSQRISQLQQQASDVAQLGRTLVNQASPRSKSRAGNSLAASVIAQARQHARQMDLEQGHYLYGNQPVELPLQETSHSASDSVICLPRQSQSKRFIGLAGVAAAAAIVLAVLAPWRLGNLISPAEVAIQQAGSTEGDPTQAEIKQAEIPSEPSSPNDALPGADERWVGQFGPMTFVLVADVQITATALQNRNLEKILTASGITRVAPILADAKILKALDDSRMIVDPDTKSSKHIFVTVIRANMRDIDTALQNIWKDERSFPKVGLNMAIDARAALTREILNSVAGRLSLSESFAIPVTAAGETTRMADSRPLPGSGEDVTYVSSARRAAGWGQADSLSAAGADSMATILLVTHLVE
jgi:hypothetical protein